MIPRRFLAPVLGFILGVGVLGGCRRAEAEAVAVGVAPGEPLVPKIVTASLVDASDKMAQIAESIPASIYDWRPTEGVRSTAEVLRHMAGSNYFLAQRLGSPPPDGLDPRTLGEGASKAELVAIFRASVLHVRAAILALPIDSLDEEIEFFGRKAPRARLALMVADHTHEHLGQLIAYARMNGIVPPWSD